MTTTEPTRRHTGPTPSGTLARKALLVASVALLVDMLVYGLAVPVLPMLPAVVAAGPAATGILFASYAAAMILVTPLAGRAVDRRGPRGPLLAGLIGLSAATGLFGLGALGAPFALLICARVLQGLAAGTSWVAALSLIATTTPPATRGRAMGTALSVIAIGTLLGPPLGGLMAQHIGPAAPFLFAALLAIVDGVLRVLLVPAVSPATDRPVGPTTVLRQPGSIPVTVLVAVSAAAVAAVEPLLAPHLYDTARASASTIGLVFAAAVIAGAIANPAVGHLAVTVGPRPPVLAGLAVTPAALTALGCANRPLWAALAAAFLGIGVALLAAPAALLIGQLGERCHPPAVGGAYALYNLAYATGLALGPAASGALSDVRGYRMALTVVGLGLGVAILIILPRLPQRVAGHSGHSRDS